MYELSKEIKIEMAHRLPKHNGRCRNIHGHSWHIEIFYPTDKLIVGGPSDGMGIDFSELKKAIVEIDEVFDHTLCLSIDDPLVALLWPSIKAHKEKRKRIVESYGYIQCLSGAGVVEDIKLIIVEHPPTSEILAGLWLTMIQEKIPQINKIAVKETCTSKVVLVRDVQK